MRKLDLASEKSIPLITDINQKISGHHTNTKIKEVFISKSKTIYVNVSTKNDGEYLFILRLLDSKELELITIMKEKTFVPVADSELIGLLHSEVSGFESFRVITDIDSEICVGEKAKQVKDKNSNYLIIPINYKTSRLDLLLDLNSNKILGYIDYNFDDSIIIDLAQGFSLSDFERDFVDIANETFNINEGNRSRNQYALLQRVLGSNQETRG